MLDCMELPPSGLSFLDCLRLLNSIVTQTRKLAEDTTRVVYERFLEDLRRREMDEGYRRLIFDLLKATENDRWLFFHIAGRAESEKKRQIVEDSGAEAA